MASFFLFILLAGAIVAVWGYCQMFCPAADNEAGGAVKFSVNRGDGVKEIAAALEEQKLIRSAWWFETYVWLNKDGANLKAGDYSISRSLNAADVASLMTGGKVLSSDIQITFPEGFTLRQTRERLLEQGFSVAGSLDNQKMGDFQLQYKFLNGIADSASLEGFLFPDTYRFHKDAEAKDIAKRFLDNFDKKLTPDLREAISRQGKNLYEVVILASIVQQEAIGEEDMPLIAGVFANRLRIGMALESDATVNYVTGKKDRQVSYDDLKIRSPYNTYLNRGLPPGPICNPGIAAIKAAISPTATDYLFFLHPLNGPTIFSKTLAEHNQNKARYLK